MTSALPVVLAVSGASAQPLAERALALLLQAGETAEGEEEEGVAHRARVGVKGGILKAGDGDFEELSGARGVAGVVERFAQRLGDAGADGWRLGKGGEEVVGALVQRTHAFGQGVARREHQHRQRAAAGPQALHEFVAP